MESLKLWGYFIFHKHAHTLVFFSYSHAARVKKVKQMKLPDRYIPNSPLLAKCCLPHAPPQRKFCSPH